MQGQRPTQWFDQEGAEEIEETRAREEEEGKRGEGTERNAGEGAAREKIAGKKWNWKDEKRAQRQRRREGQYQE